VNTIQKRPLGEPLEKDLFRCIGHDVIRHPVLQRDTEAARFLDELKFAPRHVDECAPNKFSIDVGVWVTHEFDTKPLEKCRCYLVIKLAPF
jgi:hypothetical protein